MDAFDRYCKAYLGVVPHPFQGLGEVSFNANDLRDAVACVRLVLEAPVPDPRLSDLRDRFLGAFHAYLETPRDQDGPLVNAVERLAQLVEPYLKKLVLLFYPTLVYQGAKRRAPLWHFGTEQILKDLQLVSSDLKKAETAYWQGQAAEAAIWRLAYVSRHKGTHEAHLLDLPSLERMVTAVVAALLLAARHALSDPKSSAKDHAILRDGLRFQELLRVRSETFGVTGELPTSIEHIRLFLVRDQISLDESQARLLFRSYCAGHGPVFYFLRGRKEDELMRWAYDLSGSPDEAVSRGAVAFLLSAGHYLPLQKVAELFSHYRSRFRLASYLSRAPSRRDLEVLWQLALRHRSPVVRESATTAFVQTASEADRSWLRRAAASTSPHAFNLFLRWTVRLANQERLPLYRRNLTSPQPHLRRLAAIALGAVGARDDINLLQRVARTRRRDNATKSCAIIGLGMLAARHGDHGILRRLLSGDGADTARLPVLGVGLLGDGAQGKLLVPAFRRARREVAAALRDCASPSLRPAIRRLLVREKLDEVGRLLVLALCRCARADDFIYLIRLMARYGNEPQWDSYEIMQEVAPLARGARGGRQLLRGWMHSSEFWRYYGSDRPEDQLPVVRYENLVLMRGLIGLAFGELARPTDIPRLRKMLRHSYWAVNRGGENGLMRVGGEEALRSLLAEANTVGEEVRRGLLEAIIGLDAELYCPLPGVREDFRRFGALRSE